MAGPKIDEIGPWSEVKLDILKRYAVEYSKILSNTRDPALSHIYIDAFAGTGFHLSKLTGEMVLGSPLNALLVRPPFREYHLVDLDGDKVAGLQAMVGTEPNVHLYHGDCNQVLTDKVFPKVQFKDYKRGLCLLDPYKLTLQWNVIKEAGSLGTLDVFLNFPIHAINRAVLLHDPGEASEASVAAMNAYWGDDSWRSVAYQRTDPDLFGNTDLEKVSNEKFATAFRERLRKIAGFKRVPKPLAMCNSKGSTVYYLFFASHKGVAEDIVKYIFEKFGTRSAQR